jgi:hypothetical protein
MKLEAGQIAGNTTCDCQISVMGDVIWQGIQQNISVGAGNPGGCRWIRDICPGF